MVEIFKDIEGYEGLYQVSNFGRVKSLERTRLGMNGCLEKVKERILKPDKNKDGYLRVKLCKDGKEKKFSVHRLVAEAFIPNPENKPEINHKDETRTNNCVSNLEWCERKYNCNYGTRNEKLSKKIICVETEKVYLSSMEVERQTNIYHSSITRCCKGKRKTAGKFHWQYIN